MTENWDKICRMCSHQTEVLDSLFEKQRNVYLPDIIKEAFGLQVLEYDNLPTKICKSCTTRILFIEDSRQEFLKNDMKLRKILAQNINIEMVPIEDPADGPSPISSRVKVEVDEDVLMRESFVNSMNDNNHPPPGIKVQHSNSHEGHHSEQHFGENNEVKSFLAKTGLLNLLQAFEKHEIEYENIALLTEKHIEAITPIANRQINLRKAIQKYFYQQNAQYTVVELEETQSPARPQHVTLDKICAYSEVGKKFLDYYQQHKTYDDVYRDYLARAVVDYYYQNNSKFFDSTYKEMTKIITDYLPNELPETWYYCDSDQRTGGKLYLRYSYITRPIRKAGCSKMARTKRSMEADKDFDIDKQKKFTDGSADWSDSEEFDQEDISISHDTDNAINSDDSEIPPKSRKRVKRMISEDRGRPLQADIPNRLHAKNFGHFPERVPATGKKTNPSKRCNVCYKHGFRSETIWQCKVCQIPLHIAECFETYHTLENY